MLVIIIPDVISNNFLGRRDKNTYNHQVYVHIEVTDYIKELTAQS